MRTDEWRSLSEESAKRVGFIGCEAAHPALKVGRFQSSGWSSYLSLRDYCGVCGKLLHSASGILLHLMKPVS